MEALSSYALGFGVNLVIIFIIVRFIYYPRQRAKDYVFTFFAFNTIIYFVMGLFSSSAMSLGAGFGLFAIFSILRYRTNTIPIREMTYLFIVTALPVINSVFLNTSAYVEFAVSNVSVIAVLYILEQGWGFRYEIRKTINYERIDMIRPEKWPELIADLEERTGLSINRIEIGDLNFLRDSAHITIYCDADAFEGKKVRLIPNFSVNDD
ncbi:DUF4956 domain-containing protein [Phototrophicus methaneseepsis]|uniref:DUF4956 domain-containing protein n=1 Tax=Phototrophicus methaneseepsis TaxID=2710758 RepID=A0A7S8IDZ4_9CHLR|nr:DUF4956 domain-containing protein [Phototrophicus methaneseepsis]QPC82032.1 DUF4956 domain-containing protein [Phototrophicus methaneseepsis]